MPVILFVIDTSLSMNRKSESGHTQLDQAKNAVDAFIKCRQRDPTSRTDRYMLLTTESPYNIKVDWETSKTMENFNREMKNLKCNSDSNLGEALTKATDLLNVHRATSGIDHYGCGRLPWYVDFFSMIILITDGESIKNNKNLDSNGNLHFHESKLKSYELTVDPYRWDQRLFTIVLKQGKEPNFKHINTKVQKLQNNYCNSLNTKIQIPNLEHRNLLNTSSSLNNKNHITEQLIDTQPINFKNSLLQQNLKSTSTAAHSMQNSINDNHFYPNEDSNSISHPDNLNLPNPFTYITEETGGQSFIVNSRSNLNKCLEKIVTKIYSGVICNFKVKQLNSNVTYNDSIAYKISSLPVNLKKMLLLKTKANSSQPVQGHWPIPESFFPEVLNTRQLIPLRKAQPEIIILPMPEKQLINERFPFDKYELENKDCQFTKQVLEIFQLINHNSNATNNNSLNSFNTNSDINTNQNNFNNLCWYVYVIGCDGRVQSSLENNVSHFDIKNLPPPFGYIKPNSSFTGLNLFTMPYDFPSLLPLIRKLFEKMEKNQPIDYTWRKEFDSYIRRCPVYYYKHLQKALHDIKAPPDLINENLGKNKLSQDSQEQLAKMKQLASKEAALWRRHFHSINGHDAREQHSQPTNSKNSLKLNSILNEEETTLQHLFGNFKLENFKLSKKLYYPYLDPYHIKRSDLLNQLTRMKRNLRAICSNQHNLIETAEFMEIKRSRDINQMGLFEDRMKNMVQPLRPIKDKKETVRQRTFGNPFKRKSVSQKDSMSYDEGIDLDDSNRNPMKKKRMAMNFKSWMKLRNEEGANLPSRRFNPLEKNQDLELDNELPNMDDTFDRFNEGIPLNRSPSPDSFIAHTNLGRNSVSPFNPNQKISKEILNKFKQAKTKIGNLLRQPGNSLLLKNKIKSEIAVFNQDVNNEKKLIEITMFLATKFKRYVIFDYLNNILKMYEDRDKLKREESSRAKIFNQVKSIVPKPTSAKKPNELPTRLENTHITHPISNTTDNMSRLNLNPQLPNNPPSQQTNPFFFNNSSTSDNTIIQKTIPKTVTTRQPKINPTPIQATANAAYKHPKLQDRNVNDMYKQLMDFSDDEENKENPTSANTSNPLKIENPATRPTPNLASQNIFSNGINSSWRNLTNGHKNVNNNAPDQSCRFNSEPNPKKIKLEPVNGNYAAR